MFSPSRMSDRIPTTFLQIRQQIENRVKQLLTADVTDNEQITCFVEIMKATALCVDFNEGHIAFLDTLWNRSREMIQNRRQTLRHLDLNSQLIHLNLETELMYKEMRAELMQIIKERVQVNEALRKTSVRTMTNDEGMAMCVVSTIDNR